MKRTILILVLLSVSILSRGQFIKLGFQASPHLSWMKSSDVNISNQQSRAGIKYGLEADLFLLKVPRYSLNTGLYISNHSFKARYNVTDPLSMGNTTLTSPVSVQYKLNYIEIPLDIKLRSDQFYRMTYFGQFGITNLINISASAISTDGKLNSANVSESIGLYNMGMLMGGGVEYDLGGNTAVNCGVQYTNYFIDATTIKGLDEKTTIKTVRLVIGVMF
ncbi:MAG TPA: outer membrane beta-barrel protein [Prolixibacteraceae bacterium]|nr:outer membrane beta-barrel protein [Prolixibacteraceae bacterium]